MGPVLLEEKPFACVVFDGAINKVCSFCFKRPDNLQRCSRCHIVRYCCKDCQRSDFADHKKECGYLVRASMLNHPVNWTVRLVGRVILKLKRKNAPAFNGRTFDSLKPKFDGSSGISPFVLPRVDNLVEVHNYLFGEDLPSSDEVVKTWAKIMLNRRSILNDKGEHVGCGIYLGISELCHSCDPDVSCQAYGRKAVVRAVKPGITCYSSKLKRCYLDSLHVNLHRRELLKNLFAITCNCSICVDKDRDPVAMSLRCTHCSNGYCIFLSSDLMLMKDSPHCALCGKKTAVGISDAVQIMAELERRIMAVMPIFTSHPMFTSGGFFGFLSDMQLYKRAKEVLSGCNLYLYQFGRILEGVMPSSLSDMAMVSEDRLECMKFYLTESFPTLAGQYLETGICQLQMQNFHASRELAQKATELLTETHGAEHILTKDAIAVTAFCDKFLSSHKRLDQSVVRDKILKFLDSLGRNWSYLRKPGSGKFVLCSGGTCA